MISQKSINSKSERQKNGLGMLKKQDHAFLSEIRVNSKKQIE